MAAADPFEAIVAGAGSESRLWASALLPPDSREAEPSFSPLAPPVFAVGLETVYEAYLVHYGRPRLFAPPNRDEAVLLGDYLYAHGLVRIADAGGVPAVATMAELISRCASLRADGHDGAPGDGAAADGGAWIAAVRLLGGEPADADIDSALARHSARVAP
jgi:hypothetical protein